MTSLFLQSHWRTFVTSVDTLLKGRYCLFPDFFWHTYMALQMCLFTHFLSFLPSHTFTGRTWHVFFLFGATEANFLFISVLKVNSVFSTLLPSKPAHWISASLRSFTSWPSPYTTKVKVGVLWTAIRSREKPDWTHYTAIKHFVPINT